MERSYAIPYFLVPVYIRVPHFSCAAIPKLVLELSSPKNSLAKKE